MGIIIGKLRRKKTSYEVLETLDKEIKSIEDYRISTEQYQQKIVGRFIIYSAGVYLIMAFLYYFYYFPDNLHDKLLYMIPFILVPVIIFFIKCGLTWYYKRKISRKQNKLINLREQKKKILEKVMETETYKVAKSILDKFAAEPLIRKPITSSVELTTPAIRSVLTRAPVSTVTSTLRQRTLPSINQQFVLPTTPIRSITQKTEFSPIVKSDPTASGKNIIPMPRTILPRDRSVFDKMVDYLVGDGPSNRYALICNSCSSHNGMAFKEEFEYISFRCCYCYTFNPARKKYPIAPKLELKPLQAPSNSDSSDSEKNAPSDSNSDDEKLPNYPQEKINGMPENFDDSETLNNEDKQCTLTEIENEFDIESFGEKKEAVEVPEIEQESEIKVFGEKTEVVGDLEIEPKSGTKSIGNKIEAMQDPEVDLNTDLKTEDTNKKPEQKD